MKILVTGANGLLGQKLVYALEKDAEVELIATSRGDSRLPETSTARYRSLDITSAEEVDRLMEEEQPDALINTAAMTQVDACETERDACWQINVKAVENLAAACALHGTHLTHLSTDFVFDGKSGPYDEEATPNPLSYYGQSKLESEKVVRQSEARAAIARTVLVFGYASNMSRSNIVLWAKNSLEEGKPLNVVDDQYRSPTWAEDLADGCIRAAKQKAEGIYNISGKDQMSILELVFHVADHWNLNKGQITAVHSAILDQKAERPPVTGFVLGKAKHDLGYEPHSFREALELMNEQMEG